jgi:hypothetical protein
VPRTPKKRQPGKPRKPKASTRAPRERRVFHSMTEMQEFFREQGKRGGKIGGKVAARRMSKAARTARARKAAIASAKVRRAKARE